MSKIGQYFLALQESGLIPWESMEEGYDLYNREECGSAEKTREVEKSASGSNGNRRQHSGVRGTREKGVPFSSGKTESFQQEQFSAPTNNENDPF